MSNYYFRNDTSTNSLFVDGYLFRKGQWTIAQSVRLIRMCKALGLSQVIA